MAAKTPSKGLDQNGEDKFQDKYWGRVPQFLKYIPEAYICEVNPEYVFLMEGYIAGTITKDQIGRDLFYEIETIINSIDCPCNLSGKERSIVDAFLGSDSCVKPSNKVNCGDSLCCNDILSCAPDECSGEEITTCVNNLAYEYLFQVTIGTDGGIKYGYSNTEGFGSILQGEGGICSACYSDNILPLGDKNLIIAGSSQLVDDSYDIYVDDVYVARVGYDSPVFTAADIGRTVCIGLLPYNPGV